ncbi:MAG: double-strand break repair protein AddB, partial [Alphaproteobacteria bacterium]
MAEQARKNIFTIDAGRPFAALLAENLLAREDYPLTDMTVLLPTRRACRNFQTSFLQLTHGKPLLLPHIQPLGDVDEQDLSLSLAGSEMLSRILDLPPAISPLRRRILLAKTIDRIEGFTSGFDKAIALADALAQFLDQIIIEGLEFSALETIVPEEFADHWQITLDFLKILGEYWPAILKEEGVIDTAERRNILMRIQADFWAESKPDKPIIAAGSTGSIPATAHLLSVVSSLPNGQVILPGLDQIIDEESWAALEDAHPQYGLKTLLNAIGVERGDVKKLEENTPDHAPFARQKLASEIMRPAQTSHEWQNTYQNDPQSLHSALDNISYIEAENRREEATVIALKFREILENPKKTGTLITPDRKLARQVSAICKRWGIEVDDSAGINLSVSPVGIFANLVCEAALNNMAPVPFMALMKHNHTHCGQEKNAYEQALYDLEKYVLRGVNPGNGFEGMRARISTLKYAPDMTHVLNFIRVIETIMQPFTERMQTGETAFFKDFLHIHLETMEALAASASHTGEEQLWSGEDGEALARLFAELWENADAFQPLDGESYMRILAHFMGGISIRPKYGTHPRLSILGQLEARLIESDFLILSGLNEGIWPPDPGHDSWMSRPMRRKFGLPSLDRAVGLAAHDFVQGFCHSDIVLTRSKTVDGTQQVPARWLQRLETILKSNNLSLKALQNSPLLSWARQIDRAFDTAPLSRPAPKPPASKRPRKLSVTKI